MLRRHHLVIIGIFAAAAGAGCSSDDDEGNQENPSTGNDAGDQPGSDAGNEPAADAGGGGNAGNGGGMAGEPPELECDVIVDDADCDESLRPIVFVHGTFGSATEISNTAQLFGSNGYCQDRFVAVEYNSLGGSPATQLAELVDQVLEATGFDQVDLAGHSQGTGHACAYLANEENKAKVAHYLNISGACNGNGVPTLSLSSTNDIGGAARHSSGDNVEQVTLEEEDHVALSGSRLAFEAMWKYLMGEDPQYSTVQCGPEMITLDGKSVTFGDNVPRAGSVIDVFEVDEQESPFERGEPALTITADDDGHFNTQIKRGVRYEFRVTDADGTPLGYGYQAPFKRSNYLARFLTASDNPVVAGASTDRVVRGPNHVGLVARYVAGAFRKDWGNSLKIDGEEILTEENAPRNESVVGLFLYDGNENGETELGAVFSGSFLMGTDVFMDASEPRWIEIEWTNEEGHSTVLKVPNWPSDEILASINLPY